MLEHSALASCTKLIITANLCCCSVCRGKDEIAKLLSRQRKGSSQQCLRLKWNYAFAWATEGNSRDGWKLWLQACSSPSLYKCACRDQCAQRWVQRLNAALSPLAPDWWLTQTTHHLHRHCTDPSVWEMQASPKPSATSQVFSHLKKNTKNKKKTNKIKVAVSVLNGIFHFNGICSHSFWKLRNILFILDQAQDLSPKSEFLPMQNPASNH